GQPLLRPAEPLRWRLDLAEGESDDYRLRLVQADGSPLPPILAVLEGHPTLYLTSWAVFKGPSHQHKHLLEIEAENRIPAPALERDSGVALLQSLGVELPSRIKDRVRVL